MEPLSALRCFVCQCVGEDAWKLSSKGLDEKDSIKIIEPFEGGSIRVGTDGWYLAGFKGRFPEVSSAWEKHPPAVPCEVEQLAKTSAELGRYLYNDVKVCVQCLRPCAYSQKLCQGCGSQLESVPVTQTENVLMGFVFGVERTTKFPLTISLRRQTPDVIVYDDLLAMSSCHLNALPTSHYVRDWRWLLRDPKPALQLVANLMKEAWEATKSFLHNAEWRNFNYRDGVSEDLIRENIICGFNSPPSQNQLHLQWIVLPLLPFHHQKLLDRTHAQKGRWFPLEYVLPVLQHLDEAGETFAVNAETSTEEIITHFSRKGIVYEDIWEKCYAKYCDSAALANWKPKDFSYVVKKSDVHSIASVHADLVELGKKVEISPATVQAEDKMKLQNYGRKYTENGQPGGTYYKHHKEPKLGPGGIQVWPGL
ncbi:unnamed protein product [Symbiodinium natans]|uniref:Uncharacterized protein n=1 Tax=Symbiodinium natans TaxID=878477 RepID=A0A812PJL9_9DINO|nr:unnamed protein product [Symbiodinium natans]